MQGPPDNQASDGLMGLIPLPVPGVDISRFRIDPLSERILKLIDGVTTVQQIVDDTGAETIEVVRRLKLLKDGGLLSWPTERQKMPRVTLPMAPPMSRPPASPAADVRQQLKRQSRPTQAPAASRPITTGVLSEKDPKTLVAEAGKTSLTGSLRFEQNDDVIIFHFEKGEPKGVEALSERHDHGAMLHAGNQIDKQMYDLYRASLARDPNPIYALRNAGVNDRKTMARLVVWRGQILFKEVQEWKDGIYRITPGSPFPSTIARCKLRLGAPARKPTFASWRKGHLTEEQTAFLNDNRARYLVETERAKKIATQMGLDEKEKRYVKILLEQAPLQLSRSLAISTLLKAQTRKIIFHLVDSGALEIHDTNPEREAPIPLENLAPMLRQLKIENHFNVLGVHAVSTEDDIRARYARRVREFDPKRFPDAQAEHVQTLAEIRRLVDRALETLGDETRRREYRQSIYTPFQLENFFNLQIEKAQAALKLRQAPAEALPIALSAWDLRPGHIVAGDIIAICLKALGRGSEAAMYKRMSVAPAPRTTIPYGQK